MIIDKSKCIKNKYNLTIPKIKKLHVINREKIGKPAFWRNDGIKAWCVSEGVGEPCDGTSYWIGIYDEDAPSYAGKFRFSFETYGGMCGWNFTKFFQSDDIENNYDLEIQNRFLKKIDCLIDDNILGF